MKTIAIAVILTVIPLLGAGCSTIAARVDDLPDIAEAEGFPVEPGAAQSFRLSPGDEIELRFVNHPEFNRKLLVRPDGKISMMFAEEVVVAGKTVETVDEELTATFGEQLKDPDLSVILVATEGQIVYVGGEVTKPGERSIKGGRITLTEAVLASGGYRRDTANLEKVILLRRDLQGLRHACTVNVEELLVGMHPMENVYLQPLDVVIVPPKDVVDINDFVDRYINRNLPGRGFFGVNIISN